MKVCLPGVEKVIEIEKTVIDTIVIENPMLLYTVLSDIHNQLSGNDGRTVVSIDEKPLDISKNVELLTQFVPFDINHKNLLSKACLALERRLTEDYYVEVCDLLGSIEKMLLLAALDIPGEIAFSKINIVSIIKASGLEFCNDSKCLAETVVDYMELVREYDKDKLFILYNIRSLISDEETYLFFDTCIRHGIRILNINSEMHEKLCNERIFVVDRDLCEIMP